jgi:hypothetical protein
MAFTEFERDLLNWFADHAPHPALAVQLREAGLASREYTGAGMYFELTVPTVAERIPLDIESPMSGPQIDAPSLPNGDGSLLWHREGVAHCIEVYTYTDSLFEPPTNYSLQSA